MTNPAINHNQVGPFGNAALDLYQRGLAVIPVGGDDGKVPMVEWGKWKRPPGHKFLSKLVQRLPTRNVGIICHLSNVTIVDIDDPELVDTMVARCGDTPLKTRTPSGGVHLWYRHNGERCANLRESDNLAVDVKGVGGFVVVPPSIRPSGTHAGKSYGFLTGSWDDLEHLPKVKPGSLSVVEGSTNKGNVHNLCAVSKGTRNDFLFRTLLRQIHACDDIAALMDVAESINDVFNPPLTTAEVQKTVESVWHFEADGRNWAGKEARAVSTASELNILLENPDALALRCVLQVNHGGRNEPFAVSPKGMAEADVIPGWGPKKYTANRRWLVDHGFLKVMNEGGKHPGDVGLFTFSAPAISKGDVLAPNITIHPSPSSLSVTVDPDLASPANLASASAEGRDETKSIKQAKKIGDFSISSDDERQLDLVVMCGGKPAPHRMDDPVAFGRMIRDARIAVGLTQAEAATLADMSRSGLGNIETGRFPASIETQRRLLDLFSVRTA